MPEKPWIEQLTKKQENILQFGEFSSKTATSEEPHCEFLWIYVWKSVEKEAAEIDW